MRYLFTSLVLLTLPLGALAASNDNNIEWSGVSHIGWQDRRPLCPTDGEAFDVLLKVYAFDITGAKVWVDDGVLTSHDLSYSHDDGPYAIWSATIPATAADGEHYWFELTDGSDTDYYSVSGALDAWPVDGGFEIDFQYLGHAPLGQTPTSDGGAVFKVWAPGASSAMIKGGWNGWSTGVTMTQLGDYWVGKVASMPTGNRDVPGANYKYIFDGGNYRSDPRARAINPGDNLNAVNVDPFNHNWQSDGYATPAFEDLIIYQAHVGTFAGRNDPVGSTWNPSRYYDMMVRADHLAELGVTAVMLNPIQEFPWDWSAGYNPGTQWSVESAYGHPEEVKAMIDAFHQRGIAVLLDIVWNHHGTSDDVIWNYLNHQIYYDDPPINTPWGPQPDFDRSEVREYLYQSLLMYLEEYRVDGFRFDATSFMDIYQSSGWGLMQTANDWVDNRYVNRIMIAEELPNDPWVTRPTSLGGAGFDAQYHMAWRDAVRSAIFDAAGGDPYMGAIADALDGSGAFLSGTQVVNYIELHDEAWPSSGGGRMVKAIDTVWPHDDVFAKGRTTLGFGLTLLAPGIPAILMGTEWLEDTDFGAGDWDNIPENRLNWQLKATHAGIFEFYKDLIGVRKTNGALRANAGIDVSHVNDAGNVIAFRRWDGSGNLVLVVANFANTDYYNYQIGVPSGGMWYELVNNQAPGYEGEGGNNCGGIMASTDDYDGFSDSLYLKLPRMGLMVLRHDNPPNDFLDADFDLYNDVCDNCPSVANGDQADYNGDGIGDACDCNDNGVRDSDDIAGGTSYDSNGNGVPDECEGIYPVGDMNCDGLVNFGDIDPFVLAITDANAYSIAYPDCDQHNADINGDALVNFGDIDPFVALITGG